MTQEEKRPGFAGQVSHEDTKMLRKAATQRAIFVSSCEPI